MLFSNIRMHFPFVVTIEEKSTNTNKFIFWILNYTHLQCVVSSSPFTPVSQDFLKAGEPGAGSIAVLIPHYLMTAVDRNISLSRLAFLRYSTSDCNSVWKEGLEVIRG